MFHYHSRVPKRILKWVHILSRGVPPFSTHKYPLVGFPFYNRFVVANFSPFAAPFLGAQNGSWEKERDQKRGKKGKRTGLITKLKRMAKERAQKRGKKGEGKRASPKTRQKGWQKSGPKNVAKRRAKERAQKRGKKGGGKRASPKSRQKRRVGLH